MSKSREEELQDLHNEGQKDGTEYGNYDPPTSPASAGSVLFDTKKEHQEKVENKEAYDSGWRHSRDQR